jgi:hypothetical protein
MTSRMQEDAGVLPVTSMKGRKTYYELHEPTLQLFGSLKGASNTHQPKNVLYAINTTH